MIIDGKDLILGRLATYAAKRSLEGDSVIIVNAEKVVLTGNKKLLLKNFIERQHMGHAYNGPFYPKMPDRIVRRTIRGMLPYKQERGMKAYKRIKCFMGLPESYKNQPLETVPGANYSKLKTLNFITINDLDKSVGKGVH